MQLLYTRCAILFRCLDYMVIYWAYIILTWSQYAMSWVSVHQSASYRTAWWKSCYALNTAEKLKLSQLIDIVTSCPTIKLNLPPLFTYRTMISMVFTYCSVHVSNDTHCWLLSLWIIPARRPGVVLHICLRTSSYFSLYCRCDVQMLCIIMHNYCIKSLFAEMVLQLRAGTNTIIYTKTAKL